MRLLPLRPLAVAMLPALLWMGVSPVWAHHGNASSHEGSLLVAIATYRGGSPTSEVLAVTGGTTRVLLHRPHPALSALAPSPDGSRVAALGCCSPATAGIWAFNRDGTHLHRVVQLPPSLCGNPLSAGSIVWSPGGRRLAYVVYIPSDAIRSCPPNVHDVTGVWVTPYDHPRPRQVEADTFVFSSSPLSWSPDARTLAVNGGTTPAGGGGVRALDVATGVSRHLARGAGYGVYAPVTGALAFVTVSANAVHTTRIWVAGADGRRRHVLVSTTLRLSDSPLTWSPNGRSIVYVTDTGTVYTPGARTLVVAGAVARHPRTLAVDRRGALDFPAWSPDGLHLAYSGAASCACPSASAPGMGTAIFTVDVATGVRSMLVSPRQLLAGLQRPSQVTGVAWSVR